MPGTIIIKVDPNNYDPDAVMDEVLKRLQKGFDSIVGPHITKAAQKKAFAMSVGKIDRLSAAKPIQLASADDFRTGSRKDLLLKLQGIEAAKGKRALTKHFVTAFGRETQDRGVTQYFRGTGAFKGLKPDIIQVKNGALKGSFRHTPGTLARSIHYEGSKRVGDDIVASVRASAPYAAAIHRGFTHKGGRKHTGSSSKIPGRPFLVEALMLAFDDATNASSYEK